MLTLDLQSRIGLKIKGLRENKHLSQTQLALLVGYKDKTAIAKVEAGKVDLPQSKILAFSKALDVTPADLLDDKIEKIEIHNDIKSSGRILQYYNKLNEFGKKEATKRVEELTYIPMYNNEQDTNLLNAAHSLNNATSEEKANDEDIMNDENF